MIEADVVRESLNWLLLLVGGPSGAVGAIKGLRSLSTFRSDVRGGLTDIKRQLRRIDAHTRVAADVETDPVFFVDAAGDVTFVNRAFTSTLGWNREDLEGNGWLSALHPLDRQTVATEWFRAVKDERYFSTRARAQRRDGGPRDEWYTIQALVVRCQDGEFFGWRGQFIPEARQ